MPREAVSHFLDEPSSGRSVSRGASASEVHVLVLTALKDELEAVLLLGEGGRSGWAEERDRKGLRYHRRTFATERGEDLTLAAAWTGDMGSVAASQRAQQLDDELRPECLATCGICAGDREKVALGDVI